MDGYVISFKKRFKQRVEVILKFFIDLTDDSSMQFDTDAQKHNDAVTSILYGDENYSGLFYCGFFSTLIRRRNIYRETIRYVADAQAFFSI